MAENVEWKARAQDPRRQRELADRLADRPPELLEQLDTFFLAAHGRLKLRQLAADHGELIYYERADQAGPKRSAYSLVSTDQPEALSALLARALGVRGTICKRRWLYRVGQTRIHFDEVEELGTYLEVEVVLESGQAVSEGERIAEEIRRQLGVRDEDLVEAAYIDLLMPG